MPRSRSRRLLALLTAAAVLALNSPSRPQTAVVNTRPDTTGDDAFIDVELNIVP